MHIRFHPPKMMTLRQKKWHGGVIKTVFKTQSNFNRMRRKKRIAYNGRSAFMKFKGYSIKDINVIVAIN